MMSMMFSSRFGVALVLVMVTAACAGEGRSEPSAPQSVEPPPVASPPAEPASPPVGDVAEGGEQPAPEVAAVEPLPAEDPESAEVTNGADPPPAPADPPPAPPSAPAGEAPAPSPTTAAAPPPTTATTSPPSPEPPPAPPTTTTTDLPPPPPPTTTTTTEPGADVTILITLVDGRIEAERRYEAYLGETVELRVTSDVAEEVHLHGYDLYLQLEPGAESVLVFEARLPGVWEAELHPSHRELFQLQVS